MSIILDNFDNIVDKNIFYRAVVEDRNDPKKLNRCRVRILGIHDFNTENVPVSTLPWAEMAPPVIYGGISSGIGITSVPVHGTWVWVFLDAGDFNRPVITASMYGVPSINSDSGGFIDPDGQFPKSDRLNEPDTNRLARNEKVNETLIETTKKNNQDKGIATATGSTWKEPDEKSSSAKYPDNHVIETITNNYIEFDDTKNNSRIHFFHNSGTYDEMRNNGDRSIKTVGAKTEIVDKDNYFLNKSNTSITVWGDYEHKVDGSEERRVNSYRNEIIKGDVTEIYKSKHFITVSDDVNCTYKSNKNEHVSGKCTEKYDGGQTVDGGPKISMTAGMIYLN